jgi:hypothetical protein
MKQTLLALALALPLMACSPEPQVVLPPPSEEEIEQKLSDAQTQSAPQEDGIGSEVAAGVAGAAVGALAVSALSNNNRSSGYEVEKCDWDDKPWEPECRGTAKYYKWKAEQDRKAKLKAEQRKKSIVKRSYYKRKK